ncbi:MAG TPA: 2-amino-4-hydroxy-6-hydroxymethyldihydropteridine diphosphokinase [Melioribacteraceae bacterium]|nr:2-amino-4-hydroxy-6-hydroxymethyldihydropteridine diphosphokinase [Melioribacteraceae bacterium]
MVSNVYLGLGSNLTDKKENIITALKLLKKDHNIIFDGISSLYVSKPFGVKEQNDFLNLVVKIKTHYSPFKLLEICKMIERMCGRKKTKKWGPRKIDIDILFYNNLVLNTDFLKIPHISFCLRDFVIVPLMEIENSFIHPINKKKIKEIENDLIDRYIVEKINFNEEEIV